MIAWRATPRGWGSWDYDVADVSGRPVGHLGFAFWRERGGIDWDEGHLEIARDSGWGAFVMTGGGALVARARKRGFFSRTFDIEMTGGSNLTMCPAGLWANDMVLFSGETEVGRIAVGAWSRKIEMRAADDISEPIALFALWLVVLLRRRAAAAAS